MKREATISRIPTTMSTMDGMMSPLTRSEAMVVSTSLITSIRLWDGV